MRRATVKEINALVNHPLIYPSTGLPKGYEINAHSLMVSTLNIALISAPGAMFFEYISPNEYDCHFLFLPCCSGAAILQAARAMLHEMFTKHKAYVITGKPPRDNRAVRLMGNALGFKKIPNSSFTDVAGRKCDVYELKAEKCHSHS